VDGITATEHTLNTGFRWTDHVGPYRFITEEQGCAYDRDGYFVLEDAFTDEQVLSVIAAIDPIEERQTEELRARHNGTFFIARADDITFSTHLVQGSPEVRQFTASSVLVDLCADLIGPDVRLYWDQAVYKKPDTVEPFPWHQDNGYAFVEPQQYLTCWIALTDATVDNGCPWVVPGVHRRGTLAHQYTELGFVCLTEPAGAVAVPVRRGSIVVFSSLTPHATGPNTTDAVRKAYIVQYAPAGAYVVQRGQGTALIHLDADDESRQFAILRDGARVDPPPMP
jgi:ectoine hydroxylase-related dioxygenase (phytanoyl-CoA dioxygenase family)